MQLAFFNGALYGDSHVFRAQQCVGEYGLRFAEKGLFIVIPCGKMSDDQLLHFCVASYLCGLCGRRMECLSGSRLVLAAGFSFLEKQVGSFFLFYNLRPLSGC